MVQHSFFIFFEKNIPEIRELLDKYPEQEEKQP